MTTNSGLDDIRRQVMWNRLISVVEEQARTLVRTAFSTSTREAGDLSAGVFDPQGRMLAQSVTGTPGHVNSMAASVIHFLAEFPVAEMSPGEIFLTNDPWRGTGHLFDLVVLTPVFRGGQVVALFACTSHVVDIGGIGFSVEGRDVFYEGLFLPIMRLAVDGEFDDNVMRMLRANVREPVQVEGDLYSLAACNDVGARRLLEMMDEYGLHNLDALGNHIIDRSRAAMLEQIGKLTPGTYTSSMRIDGIEEPIDLVAAMTVSSAGITIDFDGTSPMSTFGINVPMAYTDAYTSFGVRCIVGPEIPNNAGSLETVTVTAPEGTILNAPHPAPVTVRHVVGQMLPDTIFGCLHQVLPGRVPAEGTSSLWNIHLDGTWADGTSFNVLSFHSGGAGARPTKDGLSATAFPSGVRNMPVEINEAISPMVFWRKELRTGSGGDGEHRGGLGQVMEISNREGGGFRISATYERTTFAPQGREGGGPGATGRLSLISTDETVKPQGRSVIPGDERLRMEFPGGAGYGNPSDRDPAKLEADRLAGLVD